MAEADTKPTMVRNTPVIEAIDCDDLQPWLDDPARPLADLMAQLPFLTDEAHARRFLDELQEGLDDVAAGRTVPHEDVVRDMEERRRLRHADAAE